MNEKNLKCTIDLTLFNGAANVYKILGGILAAFYYPWMSAVHGVVYNQDYRTNKLQYFFKNNNNINSHTLYYNSLLLLLVLLLLVVVSICCFRSIEWPPWNGKMNANREAESATPQPCRPPQKGRFLKYINFGWVGPRSRSAVRRKFFGIDLLELHYFFAK